MNKKYLTFAGIWTILFGAFPLILKYVQSKDNCGLGLYILSILIVYPISSFIIGSIYARKYGFDYKFTLIEVVLSFIFLTYIMRPDFAAITVYTSIYGICSLIPFIIAYFIKIGKKSNEKIS